jgi:starch synthase (maltosyl-transferring)
LSYHNLTVLPSSDPGVLAFARHTPAELTGTGQADTLIVVVNLDGHNAHQSMIHLECGDLGLPGDRPLNMRDELTGREFQWGWDNYVSLAPWADVAHILSVQ